MIDDMGIELKLMTLQIDTSTPWNYWWFGSVTATNPSNVQANVRRLHLVLSILYLNYITHNFGQGGSLMHIIKPVHLSSHWKPHVTVVNLSYPMYQCHFTKYLKMHTSCHLFDDKMLLNSSPFSMQLFKIAKRSVSDNSCLQCKGIGEHGSIQAETFTSSCR